MTEEVFYKEEEDFMFKLSQVKRMSVATAVVIAALGGAAPVSVFAKAQAKTASASASVAVTMTDAQGHKVKIPAAPKRILALGLEDELVTLGIKPVAQLALGTDIQSDLQKQLKGVPEFNLSAGLSPEKVESYNPDLILLNSTGLATGQTYAQLSKIAPTYVFNAGAQNWRQTLLTIGKMVHKTAAAQKALKSYDAVMTQASTKLHKAIGNKKVAILWVSDKTLYVVTKGWFSGQVLYGDLGLTPPKVANVSGDNGFPPISMEALPSMGAQYIFLVSDSPSSASPILNNPVWKSLPAVKAGHSYVVSYGNWVQTSGVIANTKTIEDTEKDLLK